MSPVQRQEKIRREIVALYMEPTKTVDAARKRVTSSLTMIGWLSMSGVGILVLGYPGWLLVPFALLIGLLVGVVVWMKSTIATLPELLKSTTLRPELLPEPNKAPEPTPMAVTPPAAQEPRQP